MFTEKTVTTDINSRNAYVCYDAQCPRCAASTMRLEKTLAARGFITLPLQTPWVLRRLGLKADARPGEMKVFTRENTILGGADAIVYLARNVWWAWPLFAFAQMPGAMRLFRAAYRWIAVRRICTGETCPRRA